MTDTADSIEQAVRKLIDRHRSEFDVLVVETLRANNVAIPLPEITIESVSADNLQMWRKIGDELFTNNPYEGIRE